VSADPPALSQLNGLLAAARIAHEAIYDLQTELLAGGRASHRVDELVAESARITLVEMSELTTKARRLARVWRDQVVLNPATAGSTLAQLEAECDRIEPDLRGWLGRQSEIADELQSLRRDRRDG
jgi:N-methylhydantoinase B/oxoprolinase/acetone carboxylase alpha subunit